MLGLALLARIAFTAHVAAAVSPVQDGKTIVRLVSRQNDISIVATSHGTRFSARDKAGNALATSLTIDELKQQHPTIHRQVEPAWCESADASISLSAISD